MNGMNIKAKIALTIGVLVSMIVLLVALSVICRFLRLRNRIARLPVRD